MPLPTIDRRHLLTGIAGLALAPLASLAATPLAGPYDGARSRAAWGKPLTKSYAVPPLVPPVLDLDVPRLYREGDATNSIVDDESLARHEAAAASLRRFESQLVRMADDWQRSNPADPAPAIAAAAHLLAWARARALLGRMAQQQAEFERKWSLACLALVWLRIRDAAAIPAEARAEVPVWLAAVARAVMPPYEDTRGTRTTPRNNHATWAGLAVAAAGVAADDRALFDWGIARYRLTIAQIDGDGVLPLELARARRALHYHVFAAGPAVLLAELGAANGVPLYAERDGALHRFLERTLDGVADPAWFAARTRFRQDTSAGGFRGGALAFVEPYFARFPDKARPALLAERPLSNRWLGGNLTLAFGRPA